MIDGFTNEMIWYLSSQSSDASCYMIYWSAVVILTAAIQRQGSTGWMNKIVDAPSAFADMSTARERAFVRKRLGDKGGDDVIGPGKFEPTDYVKWEKWI